MALLSNNKWYKQYLEKVANGSLELPAYELSPDRTIKMFYGEVFCRVEDCSRAQHKYSATNNLILHIKLHEGARIEEGHKGGRVAQKVVDAAVKWYKALVLGAEKNGSERDEGNDEEEEGEEEEGEEEDEGEKPPLPRKKDGSIHITNMRRQVTILGHQIPCSSCVNRNDCCKDITVCDYFSLFHR